MSEETKDLTKQGQPGALARRAEVPDGMDDDAERGELIIPRLMLVQHMPFRNVEVNKRECPPGTLVSSITASAVATEDGKGTADGGSIVVIPVIRSRKWIRFNPMKKDDAGFDPGAEPGAKIWESNDPDDPRVKADGEWGPNGEPPLATKIIEFLVMIPGEPLPHVLSFLRSSFNAGKQLSTICKYGKKPSGRNAIYAHRIRMRVKETKNEKGQFFVPIIQEAGFASDEEYETARAIREDFRHVDMKVHDVGEEPEAAPVQPWDKKESEEAPF